MKITRGMHLSFVMAFCVLMTFISACEHKRKTRFAQGDGEYVYTIDEFKGQKYTLQTGKKITRGVTTNADEVVIDDNTSVIRSFNEVEFELETDFGTFDNSALSNFQFFGQEDTEYEVRVEFTEDNFVFFKVAPASLIPSNELTYAEKIEGDLYRVPLFGLPLSKYTTERIQDDRGKSTNKMKTFEKKFLRDATHFAVKAANAKYFETELKLDMVPAKFFDEANEWFFEVTVVDRPLDNNQVYELGRQIASGKAKFYKTNKTIAVVNQNIAEELKGQDPEKQSTILEIPANWMDFKLKTTGDDAYLKEEVFNEIAPGAKYWKDREYVQLKFDKIISGIIGTDSIVANTLRVKRLEVADDYFSFIVFDSLNKISLHFSFAKDNMINEGETYPLEDWKRFGFFQARRAILTDPMSSSEESFISRTFMQRMYPKDNVVTFHITENTPRDPVFMESIEAAVDAWNTAFAEAAKGTKHEANPIKVKLDIEKPVQNGDARYHKVSFYGYEVESNLLGYGPSVKDGRNGEVYSSTNHIYLRNYREQILRNIVKYVRFRIGAYNDLNFQGVSLPNQILMTSGDIDFDFTGFFNAPSAASLGGPTSLAMDAILMDSTPIPAVDYSEVPDFGKAVAAAKSALDNRQKLDFTEKTEYDQGFKDYAKARNRLAAGITTEEQYNAEIKSSVDRMNASTCDSMAGTALSFKEIEDFCMGEGDDFKAYVDELIAINQSSGLDYRLDTEKKVFYDCAQKLMKPTLVSTLVHEFGHNFGMTHNFAGTADAKNFDRDENGVPTIRSTSVMDYAHYDADRGFKPGPYDVAAIRYAYYRAVEVVDANTGESRGIVDIDAPNGNVLSANERVMQKDPSLRTRYFQYCYDTDINGSEIPLETHNCRRRDQGSDPVSQVRALIDGFNALLLTSGQRYDNTGIATAAGIASSATSTSLTPMKLIYDKYRYSLYEKAFAKGQNDPYFDIFKASEIEANYIGAETLKKVADLKQEILDHSGDKAMTKDNMSIIRIEQKIQALPELAQYKLASEFIKDFYRELVFSEDLYCVAVGADGSNFQTVEIAPFASLRTTIYNETGRDATSCENSAVLDYYRGLLAAGTISGVSSVDKVTSVGNPASDVLYSADIQKLPIRMGIRAGLLPTRIAAVNMFANRSTVLGLSLIQSNNFFPGILDEEGFRSEILGRISDRYMNGMNATNLLKLAESKLGRPVSAGVYSNLVKDGTFYLPHYEEETALVQSLLAAYKAGAISPLASTNEKTQSVQITSSPEVSFLNFIRTAPNAADYRYFIANSTAYYSEGQDARKILESLSETYASVTIAEQLVNATTSGSINAANASQVKTRLVTFATDFSAELAAGDLTAKNILYKVRSCVKDKLASKYANKIAGYALESDPDFPYIQSVCRATGPESVGEQSFAIEKYYLEAERLIDFIVQKDNQALTLPLFESILTQVGLPASSDKKRTWAQIRDSSLSKAIKNVNPPNAFETALFQSLINDLILTPEGQDKLLSVTKDPKALDADMLRVTEGIRLELGTHIKYRDLFKKKVDILQNALYLSAR